MHKTKTATCFSLSRVSRSYCNGNCYRSLQLPAVFTLSQQTKLSPCSSSVGCGKILMMVFACGLCARVRTVRARVHRWRQKKPLALSAPARTKERNQYLLIFCVAGKEEWEKDWQSYFDSGQSRLHSLLFRIDFEMNARVHTFATCSQLKLRSKTKSLSDFACCSFQAAALTAGMCGCTTPSSTCGSEWRLSTKAAGDTRWASCWARYGGSKPSTLHRG